MDFTWAAEEEALRQEIREFFQTELPEGWGLTQFWNPDDDAQFALAHECTKTLGMKNLLAVSWPKEYGGLEWPFWRQFMFNEELANCDAPVGAATPRAFWARRSCGMARKSRNSSTYRASSVVRS